MLLPWVQKRPIRSPDLSIVICLATNNGLTKSRLRPEGQDEINRQIQHNRFRRSKYCLVFHCTPTLFKIRLHSLYHYTLHSLYTHFTIARCTDLTTARCTHFTIARCTHFTVALTLPLHSLYRCTHFTVALTLPLHSLYCCTVTYCIAHFAAKQFTLKKQLLSIIIITLSLHNLL